MIFIFGHSGFIGQHLTKFFDKNKIDYTRVNRDNLYNFNLEVSSKDIFINLIGHSHSKINNKKTYFKFINANIEVVDQIIFLAKKFNINKLIHISSLRVYVNSYLNEIKVEKKSLVLPDTIYGQTKLLADTKLIEFGNNSKTKVIILRPPLVYGKNVKGNLNLLKKLCKYSFILPFKNNNYIRSVLSVTNLCNLIKKISFTENFYFEKDIYHPRDTENIPIYEIIKRTIMFNNYKRMFINFPNRYFKKILILVGANNLTTQLFKSVYISEIDINEKIWKPDECLQKKDFIDSVS